MLIRLLLPVLIVRGAEFSYFTHEVYALLFGVLMLNLALTQRSPVSLRTPTLDYLGRISYGLYMFHPLAITLAIRAVGALGTLPNPVVNHAAVYVATLAISIALAAASYHWLETPFLTLKKRFARI